MPSSGSRYQYALVTRYHCGNCRLPGPRGTGPRVDAVARVYYHPTEPTTLRNLQSWATGEMYSPFDRFVNCASGSYPWAGRHTAGRPHPFGLCVGTLVSSSLTRSMPSASHPPSAGLIFTAVGSRRYSRSTSGRRNPSITTHLLSPKRLDSSRRLPNVWTSYATSSAAPATRRGDSSRRPASHAVSRSRIRAQRQRRVALTL